MFRVFMVAVYFALLDPWGILRFRKWYATNFLLSSWR